jgi:hypothetical protein
VVAVTTKQKQQHQKRAAAARKRNRARASPSPHAYAFTVHDSQAMGGPGKTKLYEIAKQLKAEGKTLLFKDAAGRTMVVGDMLREPLAVKEEVTA